MIPGILPSKKLFYTYGRNSTGNPESLSVCKLARYGTWSCKNAIARPVHIRFSKLDPFWKGNKPTFPKRAQSPRSESPNRCYGPPKSKFSSNSPGFSEKVECCSEIRVIKFVFVLGSFVRKTIPRKTSPSTSLCDKNSKSYAHFTKCCFKAKLTVSHAFLLLSGNIWKRSRNHYKNWFSLSSQAVLVRSGQTEFPKTSSGQPRFSEC